jgi:hypothetical protein
VRLYTAPVRHELAGVLEGDHAVAEQAPALLRVAGDNPSGLVVDRVSVGTGGLVLTHGDGSDKWCYKGHCDLCQTLL